MADGTIGASDESVWGPLRVPPVSARSVASSINRQLEDNSDMITLSRAEATETVLTLTNCSANEAELAKVSAEAERDDVRQLAESDRPNAFHDGKFRQKIEQEPESAKSRQRSSSDPTSDQVRSQKRNASGSLDLENTTSAGQSRGKARRRLSKKEVKFAEKSEALVDRLNDWHSKGPRRALQWLSKISKQLDEELQE
ncbi:hypothetical protein FQN50_002894 [Emmonsiellopsis sp. PD_5]|nr:hypothetical protein FQN50_002894 [Emmonsiellopsis sp. PD_5]